MSEFNLSEEIQRVGDFMFDKTEVLVLDSVKEFIKLDFENIKLLHTGQISYLEYMKRKEKLAGDKLK